MIKLLLLYINELSFIAIMKLNNKRTKNNIFENHFPCRINPIDNKAIDPD